MASTSLRSLSSSPSSSPSSSDKRGTPDFPNASALRQASFSSRSELNGLYPTDRRPWMREGEFPIGFGGVLTEFDGLKCLPRGDLMTEPSSMATSFVSSNGLDDTANGLVVILGDSSSKGFDPFPFLIGFGGFLDISKYYLYAIPSPQNKGLLLKVSMSVHMPF